MLLLLDTRTCWLWFCAKLSHRCWPAWRWLLWCQVLVPGADCCDQRGSVTDRKQDRFHARKCPWQRCLGEVRARQACYTLPLKVWSVNQQQHRPPQERVWCRTLAPPPELPNQNLHHNKMPRRLPTFSLIVSKSGLFCILSLLKTACPCRSDWIQA